MSASVSSAVRRRSLSGVLWYLPIAIAALAVLRWGISPQSFLIIGSFAAVALMPLPSWVWAGLAISSSLLLRVFTTSGWLPNILDFADFGFVYAGLVAVLLRRGIRARPEGNRLAISLLALLIAACVSWALQPSDLARPFLTFTLWAEPFALVLMLVLEPPSRRYAHLLLGWFGALVAIQLPFAVYQLLTYGPSDPVVGTLFGSGAGAHVVAGVTVLGGLALIAWGFAGSIGRGLLTTILAAPLLIGLPLAADAKQVLFALPIAALVLAVCARGAARKLAVAAVPTLGLVVLLAVVPAGQIAISFLEEASEGRSGKLVGLEIARGQLGSSASRWAFGLGPANGLSRAAYLTRPDKDSALLLLELEPAPLPPLADAEAARITGGTSFNTPLSSAVGVLTDVGLVGFLAFGAVVASIAGPLWSRRRDWLAQSALAGWLMSIPLAFTFDWWEQPPFMLSLALITGLALSTDRQGTPAS